MPNIVAYSYSLNAYLARIWAEGAIVTGDLTTGSDEDSTVTTNNRWWSELVDAGEPVTITYSFITSLKDDQLDNLTQSQIDSFAAPNEAFMEMAREIFAQVESITNITFIEVDENSSAFDIHQAGGDIRIGGLDGLAGFAWDPATSTDADPIAGDFFSAITFNREDEDAFQEQEELARVFLHELGHALGLEHLDESDELNRSYPVDIPSEELTWQFSLEGYGGTHYSEETPGGFGSLNHWPSTYMPYDIAALQHMYGANTEVNAGNTVYTFGVDDITRITVYDPSGRDTFDFTNQSTAVDVSLEPGQFSSVGNYQIIYSTVDATPATDSVAIAFGTIIENVRGTDFADTIWGNSANNNLKGNAGDDTLLGLGGDDYMTGSAGQDYLHGGVGNDTMWAGPGDDAGDIYIGGAGADVLGAGDGDDLVVGDTTDGSTINNGADLLMGGTGNDTILTGGWDDTQGSTTGQFEPGEQLTSSTETNTVWSGQGDDTIYGSDGDELIGGGADDDNIIAAGGNDTIYGGAGNGNDNVDGGAGNDTLYGGQGDDTVNGGEGADLIFNGSGSDVVTGGSGDDTLWGGGGDDTLTGGTGTDYFAFGTTASNDTVTDFDTDEDILSISAFNVTELSTVSEETTINGQTGILITLSDDVTVFLQGLTPSDVANIDLI